MPLRLLFELACCMDLKGVLKLLSPSVLLMGSLD